MSERGIIEHYMACIGAFHECVSPSFTLTHMQLVFLIYLNNGVTRIQLEEKTGLSKSTLNRYVQDLTKKSWMRADTAARPAGYNLIEEELNERNLRVKHIYLNNIGKKIIDDVVKICRQSFMPKDR